MRLFLLVIKMNINQMQNVDTFRKTIDKATNWPKVYTSTLRIQLYAKVMKLMEHDIDFGADPKEFKRAYAKACEHYKTEVYILTHSEIGKDQAETYHQKQSDLLCEYLLNL